MIEMDGRRARSLRSRQAIIDALIDLYRDGDLTPRLETIAERAGVTTRTIHHHFRDRDALAEAVADAHVAAHRHLFEPLPAGGSVEERVGRLVAHRAELFEAIAPVRRAGRATMHRSPAVARQQRRAAAFLRRTVTDLFGPDASGLPDTEAGAVAEVVDRLDLVLSWECWDHLRTWQHKSVREACRLIEGLALDIVRR